MAQKEAFAHKKELKPPLNTSDDKSPSINFVFPSLRELRAGWEKDETVWSPPPPFDVVSVTRTNFYERRRLSSVVVICNHTMYST